jgi:hypothetical protein
MPHISTPSRTRRGAAAGLAGIAFGLVAVTGVGPAPSLFSTTSATQDVRGNCDEPEHAADAACAGTPAPRRIDDDSTSSTSSTSSTADDHNATEDDHTSTTLSTVGQPPPAATEVRTVSAGEAGSIVVAVDGTSLGLMSVNPNPGWTVEVEHASGREIEVTFLSGAARVDVKVELEDGQVRERVRTRTESPETESPEAEAPETETHTEPRVDDSSGRGSRDDRTPEDSSGHGPGHD